MTRDRLHDLVDREAEKALLGSIIIDNQKLAEVADILQPDDLFSLGHQAIYKAMLALFEAETVIDLVTLPEATRAYIDLNKLGDSHDHGQAYLIGLVSGSFYTESASHYATQIAALAQRRRLVLAGRQLIRSALDRATDLPEVVETGCRSVLGASINGHGGLRGVAQDLGAFRLELEERIANPVDVSGLLTGYPDIDRILNGLTAGALYVMPAARPGMGKTGWLLGAAYNMAVARARRVAFFSLEMSYQELMRRLISRETHINTQALARGQLTAQEIGRVKAALDRLEASGLAIDDTPGLTPTQIRARAMQLEIQHGLDCIMVDYLQLVHIPAARGDRYIQATESARELKNLAMALHVPVVVASQLSRAVESRNDKRPCLSDLRDSGCIEEAADVVAFLYRDDYYRPDDSDQPNEASFIIAKARNGPTGSPRLYFEHDTASYYPLKYDDLHL